MVYFDEVRGHFSLAFVSRTNRTTSRLHCQQSYTAILYGDIALYPRTFCGLIIVERSGILPTRDSEPRRLHGCGAHAHGQKTAPEFVGRGDAGQRWVGRGEGASYCGIYFSYERAAIKFEIDLSTPPHSDDPLVQT